MSPSGSWLKTVFYCILAVIGWNCFSPWQALAQTKPDPAALVIGKYLGPGSCSAAACHGDIRDHMGKRAMQTEYGTWIIQDHHARAYQTLKKPVSQRMGQILGIGDPTTSAKCLTCHALSPSNNEKELDFPKKEGVSCESCHGPASGWLESHFRKNTTAEALVKCGMNNISNMVVRSETCLACHLGDIDKDKEVDHRMIAAGHPDLIFQLEFYSARQPPHWRIPDDPSYGARLWAIGQAVQLRAALDRLARRADNKKWPEFSEMDCFSCHHSLTKPETSWRQERGYSGGNAGSPPWNRAHYIIFRILAKDLDDAAARQLETEMETVYKITSDPASSPQVVSKSAHQASELAARLVTGINQAKFDQTRAARLLNEISAAGDSISYKDTRSAEQAYMALDSLFRCYDGIKNGGPLTTGAHPSVGTAIEALFSEFDNPSAYNAPRFAAGMRKVNEALRNAGVVSRASR
jgi:hypothetical protein